MDLIRTIDLAAGGMVAQRARLNVISTNLANVNTTRTEEGTPYRRKTTIFQATPATQGFDAHLQEALDKELYGVEVTDVVSVEGPFKRIFDPAHPDADQEGYVFLPNVNLVEEMVLMLNANRAYEANAAVVKAAKDMALKALEIGR
ncbi:MAG: flagellar basal body rod protein FlgC [Deltaproteobacteria bacterium]|nr:flagellar basal body rod protein FlgC [Deltaproteobacteria bacterium]